MTAQIALPQLKIDNMQRLENYLSQMQVQPILLVKDWQGTRVVSLMRKIVLDLVACLALCCAVAVVNVAEAKDSTASRQLVFDIRAQSLDGALAEFAEQSGMQLLYDSELAAARKSAGAKGRLTDQDALARLLANTGLIARFTGDKLATLVTTENDSSVIPLDTLHVEAQVLIGGRQSYERYARLLQAAVIDRVEKAEAAKFGQFRLALRLWVDGSGIVERVVLSGTTGDAATDLVIPELIRTIRIGEPPPPGMPQPVRIRISARGVRE